MAGLCISGFNTAINHDVLTAASRIHNELPLDRPFPRVDVDSSGFKEICALIAKYQLQSSLRLRLLHRHSTLRQGEVLLGAEVADAPRHIWTCPTAIADIKPQDVYGHIYSATPSHQDTPGSFCLVPTEFRRGKAAASINTNFASEFIDCLCQHGLEKVLGLQVKEGPIEAMVEFSDDSGSLLIPKDEVDLELNSAGQKGRVLNTTGWLISDKNGTACANGETRCVSSPGGHVKASRPLDIRII